MAISDEYKGFIQDILAEFGPVRVRSMFGGAGVFLDDVMFAIVASEALFLKVDDENRSNFEKEGMRPFSYRGKNRQTEMSYYELPERLYDDRDELAEWARQAYSAALKSKQRKRRSKN